MRFSAVADKLKLLSEEQIQDVLSLVDVMKKIVRLIDLLAVFYNIK